MQQNVLTHPHTHIQNLSIYANLSITAVGHLLQVQMCGFFLTFCTALNKYKLQINFGTVGS